ncbi:uncharacterized protein LOC134107905 [Pungitius pungitius]|uniref:uncharacterized protein LOC134107905 n=1 Tax=Pungitius pungitius TaxID=134920 RepID=UPI002E0EA2BC
MGRPGQTNLQRLWESWSHPEVLSTGEEAFKLAAPTTESQVVGEVDQTDKPSLVGMCPGVEVVVAGVKLPCLLDTGSQVTLFSETFFQKWLSGEQKRSPQDLLWLSLKAANGLQIPYTGYAILDFSVGGVTVPSKGVIIVKDECLSAERGILGMNVISHCWKELFQGVHPGLTVFGATMSREAKGEWQRAFAVCQKVSQDESSDGLIGVARLTRQDPVYLPPNSEMVLWTHLYGAKTRSDFCALVEGPERDDEWQVARTVTTVVKGRLSIRVRNLNPYPVLIPQRRPLANVFQVDPKQIRGEKDLVLRTVDPGVVEVAVQTNHISTKEQHPVDLLKGDGLTVDQQQQMDSLLQRWRDIFAAGDEDFGQTSAVLHSIPTGSAPPSRERYRPVPPSLYPELRELLQNMLDNDVIKESSSPWAAPIVLVKKKDGSWRFCVDYRKLNALTHKDAYPLPRIEESLTSLKQAAWYSTLDLASGYWQVDVDPRDREKTAFTTPLGLYEFQRMPFGLCNAPATFQRLMQRCLGGQVHDSLLIYLDDVVVYSPDFDTHIHHLEQVFEKLASHGLKLQPHKCSLFQKKVTYLGHVISGEGISTDPEKTAVVENWPIPSTIKQEMEPDKQAQVGTAMVESEASTKAKDNWKDWQEEDPTVAQMKNWVDGNHFPGAEERKACLPATKRLLKEWNRLHIQEGVLKRKAQEHHTGLSLHQIVVPMDKTQKLWEKYHNASGHMGIAKIEGLLRKTFYWPRMVRMGCPYKGPDSSHYDTCSLATPNPAMGMSRTNPFRSRSSL